MLTSVITNLLFDQTRFEQVQNEYFQQQTNHVFIAAHRGGRETDKLDQAPGNSIANIQVAASKSFDLYESDIEILQDDTLIVFHDDIFNNLTNTEVVDEDDALDNANLPYAKTLFLTYKDGTVSMQKIPTLEEFLLAIKGKIMAKFDLKSGTSNSQALQNIFQTVVDTGTVNQVLIRGDGDVLAVAALNGFDTRMVMRQYSSSPSVDAIETLVTQYNVKAISIPSGTTNEVVQKAIAESLIVEVHELQGVSDAERQMAWQAAVDQGVRQFHSFKPSLLKQFLLDQDLRQF